MNHEEVREMIASGDSSKLEFKSSDFRNDRLAKEVVAFSNMSGGKLLVGVEDDGVISGVEDPAKMIERIVNICRNNITPSVIPEIATARIDEKTVVLLTIEKGISKPYKVKTSNRYYIRAGNVGCIADAGGTGSTVTGRFAISF